MKLLPTYTNKDSNNISPWFFYSEMGSSICASTSPAGYNCLISITADTELENLVKSQWVKVKDVINNTTQEND